MEAGPVGSVMRAVLGRCLSIASVSLLLWSIPGAFAAGGGTPEVTKAATGDVSAQRKDIVDPIRARDAAPLRKPAGTRVEIDASDDRLQRYWYDGKRKRTLRVDPDWVADFRYRTGSGTSESGANESGANESGARESGTTPPAKVDRMAPRARRASVRSPLERVQREDSARVTREAGVSEVLRNEAGSPRALPGGVIVRLQESDRRNAYDILVEAGLRPVRALDPEQRSWLVESPAGLESLELANRLHESGRFESASPNWWRPRALK